jgi:transcriptional regulator GlxA family with amidase domain
MKHISILVPRGQYSIVNIAGAFQILNAANEFNRVPLFRVELVGVDRPAADAEGWYTVNPAKTIADLKQTDLIIVPAVHGEAEAVITLNRELIAWLGEKYRMGSELATFCIGAFLLAAGGLLNGKACSTHWGQVEKLQSMFPELLVQGEEIVTDCDGIYTSGGAYAFTNLLIYLIEKYGGRELAVLIAKTFMIDIDKGSQSPFMIFRGQKDHSDETVRKVQEYIEQHYREKFTVEQLAENHALTRRTLERRFKKATGNSLNQYAQRVRTEAAKKQLENGRKTVNEVMFQSGYQDPKAFREIFRRYAGLSPQAYKEKFSRKLPSPAA